MSNNSNISIHVTQLSKKYEIGSTQKDTLSESLTSIFKASDKEDFWALKEVSFDIHRGEVVGIIGKNGAGKSTLLKVLSKITKPTSGRVELYGRIASLLEVGTGFHPELNGRENIFLNGSLLGLSRKEIKERLDDIIEFSGIGNFIDTPVKKYSSGMYVLIAFSVAAHLNPEILLIDEVLAVGDHAFQQKCLGKMEEVASSGRTVLLVSHNLEVIENLCSKTIWIDNGQLAFYGDTREAIRLYLDSVENTQEKTKAKYLKNIKAYQDQKDIVIQADYDMGDASISPNLGFVIYDRYHRPVTGTNPILESQAIRTATARGKISITIKNPSLKNGTYTISLWFGDGSNDIEKLEHCVQFNVFNMTTHPNQNTELGPLSISCKYEYK